MPASLRTNTSRATSRPYDRRPPTASPAKSGNPLIQSHLSRNLPPASPIQVAEADPDPGVIPDDVPGLPTYAEYKRIEAGYLHSLSPRKRDKALITQAMFDKIWDVLHEPEACTIETPQFRFWVRKMFSLSRPVRAVVGGGGGGAGGHGGAGDRNLGWGAGTATHPALDPDSDAEADLDLERSMGIRTGRSSTDPFAFSAVVLHEHRPVAIMEQLYDLFCYCHVRAGHGGRDKTCAVIREHYSWVPKELTAQFVKACPTCALKRGGQAHGSVGGVDKSMLAYTGRRAVGRGGRKGRAPLELAEEAPVPVSVGWPTTGGPLDPANPEPCGVREREREREWLRARGEVTTVGPSNPANMSPAHSSGTRSVQRQGHLESCPPGRWSSVPRALTVDASFHPCDTTRSRGQPFALDNSSARQSASDREEKRSPTKIELPSLASALSNEALDENVNASLTGPGDADGECLLPPVLRPLRLLGPVPSGPESDPRSSSAYQFQIDPMLLSFNYPGMGVSSEPGSGFASDDAMSLALDAGTMSEAPAHRSLCRLRALSDDDDRGESPSVPSMNVPTLDPSRGPDSPDSSFERGAALYMTDSSAGGATLPFSLSTEFMGRSRCGSRYGYRDGPLAMLYHSSCSADEVGRELDGPLSFSIMTDV